MFAPTWAGVEMVRAHVGGVEMVTALREQWERFAPTWAAWR